MNNESNGNGNSIMKNLEDSRKINNGMNNEMNGSESKIVVPEVRTKFWLYEPTVLFDKKQYKEVWPKESMGSAEKLNAITRFVILASILAYFVTLNFKFILICIITLAVIAILFVVQSKNKKEEKEEKVKETFMNSELYNKMRNDFTSPQKNNPLMNVLLPEISYNPNRKSAAPSFNPNVEVEINKSTKDYVEDGFEDSDVKEKEILRKKLFADLGDNYVFDDSMRQFYTTANTMIPNDQGGFAEFCFGEMVSSKENNEFALGRYQPRLGSVYN